MSQTPLRQSPRQRSCIFCGSTGKITDEHIFSKWMKKHLPLNDWHVFHYLRGGSPNSFGKNTFGNWQGSTNSLRPTVVCESCNSGWMSAIETQAMECLISLIAGQSFDVTDEHQTKLSRWVSLKTMVCEYDTADQNYPRLRITMISNSINSQTHSGAFGLRHVRHLTGASGSCANLYA
jgi:hypothetical protein